MTDILELYISQYKAVCEFWLLPSHKKEIVQAGLKYPSLSRDLGR